MNDFVVRMVVALLLAAFLWAQSRATRGQPRRSRAFAMAAGALLAFAAYNGSLAAGLSIGPLSLALAAVGLALFIGAIVALIGSLREGEMRSQGDRIADEARAYRERRAPGPPRGPDDQR